MLRFASSQKLLIGIAIASSLGLGYALGAQPHMEAAVALLQKRTRRIGAGDAE